MFPAKPGTCGTWLIAAALLMVAGCERAAIEQEVFRHVKKHDGEISLGGKGPVIKFSQAKITDDDLAPLAKLGHIHRLTLEFVDITDAGVDHLLKLEQLDDLKLRETKLTDEGIKRLKDKFPHLAIP